MKYVKLISGRITYAPKKLINGNATIYNPTAEQLIADGYKPLQVDPMPTTDSRHHLEAVYTDTADAVVQSWIIVENPPEEPTLEEQVEAQAQAIEELAMLLAEVMG